MCNVIKIEKQELASAKDQKIICMDMTNYTNYNQVRVKYIVIFDTNDTK